MDSAPAFSFFPQGERFAHSFLLAGQPPTLNRLAHERLLIRRELYFHAFSVWENVSRGNHKKAEQESYREWGKSIHTTGPHATGWVAILSPELAPTRSPMESSSRLVPSAA